MEVPTDYEKPDGDTLELKVKVIPAEGDGGRSLFVNPGGPGGEAQGFADYMGPSSVTTSSTVTTSSVSTRVASARARRSTA